MTGQAAVIRDLYVRFGETAFISQPTHDGIPTLWVSKDRVRDVLRHLKSEVARPYPMLYDLTAIDERVRNHREGQPESDFTVVYQLLSLAYNEDIRLKVALTGDTPSLSTITDVWPAANWYERQVWDLFGIRFEGHP
ncbi:MAG TPA: NADH-quinone oxidoreductase subunit C, partial [Gammaproteobacteria bacterium]|nr:NADH-quinone oxidoreductase subunit C [Gammaproteobacteria bacterium]